MERGVIWLSVVAIAACVPTLFGDPASAQDTRNLRAQVEEFRRGERKGVGSSSMRDYTPRTIEQLTADADLVLVGTLKPTQSYLSPNEQDVLTDYAISEYRILAGALMATPGPLGTVTPPVLTMVGGEMMLDGVPARTTNFNFEPFDEGRYLLFLARSGKEPWRYRLAHAGVFALNGEQVRPMLNQSDDVYINMTQTPAGALVTRVEETARRLAVPSSTPK